MQRNSHTIGRMLASFMMVSIMSSIILQVDSMVDGIIVGQILSSSAVSAIGFVLPIISAILFLPAIIYHGTAYIAAKYIGVQDYHRVSQLFTMCLIFSPLAAMLGVIPVMLFSEHVVGLFTSDSHLAPIISEYLPYIIWICVAFSFQYSVTDFLKVIGQPKMAFYTFVMQTVLNISLDLLLVGILGIKGSAIASLVSVTLPAAIVLIFIQRSSSVLKLESFNMRTCIEELPKCIKLGASASMLMLLLAFQNMLLNYIFIHTQGADAMFVISIYNQILMVAYIVLVGAVDSVYQIGGSLYGEDDMKGYRMLFNIIMRLVVGGLALITIAIVCFPTWLAAMFGADAQLAEWSRVPLCLMAMQLIPFGVTYVMTVNYNVNNFKQITVTVISFMPVMILSTVYFTSAVQPDAIWIAYTLSQWLLLGMTLCAGRYVSRHSSADLSRLTLIRRKDPIPSYSVTVRSPEADMETVVREVESFLSSNTIPQSHSLSQWSSDVVRTIAANTAHDIDFRIALYPSRLCLSIKARHLREMPLPTMPPAADCDIKEMNGISCIHINYELTDK